MNANKMSILDVLKNIESLSPIRIVFNDSYVLYDDYSPGHEEREPFNKVIPERLNTVLTEYDILINKYEVHIVHFHHSLIYLYGEKIKKNNS